MGLWSRFRLIFTAKANRVADRLEDPADTLELAYQKQLNALQKVRQGIADVVTSQKQLEIQQRQMEANRGKLEGLARKALQQGREDLAASALTQSELVEGQLGSLEAQIGALASQRESLEAAGERLQARVAAMRTQKETLKAQYSAAKASVSAGETVTGISKEMTEIEGMLDRARQKMLQTQARAEAVNELMDTGLLAKLGAGASDTIEAEVRALETHDTVEARLAQMKSELNISGPSMTKRLEPAETTDAADEAAAKE